MKKRWQILETRPQSAAENMEIDIQLLKGLRRGDDPILRFYNWSKASGTYGYFLNPSRYLDLAEVESRAISLARRPTGGGVSFHIGDLFLQKNRVVQAMQRHASSLLRAPYTRGDVEEVRARLKESLIFHLTQTSP